MASGEGASPLTPQTKLDLIERVGKLVALLAIPIVIPIALAIYSAKVQEGAQKQSINRDYVQLAVTILKERKEEVSPGLRDWAVDLLTEHSPTKFTTKVISDLKSGVVSFPALLGTYLGGGKVGAVSPDGKFLAVGDNRGFGVTDLKTGEVKMVSDAASAVVGLDFSPDSALLAVAYENGNVSLLDMNTMRVSQSYKVEQPISAVKFSPDGSLQIVTTVGSIYVFGSDGRLLRKTIIPRPPRSLSVAPQ